MNVSVNPERIRRPIAIWLIFIWCLHKAAGYAAGPSFLKNGANALPPADRLLVSVGLSSLAIAQWLHGGVRGSLLAANAVLNCGIGAGVLWDSWRLRRAGRLS